jgi:CRP/FNR family transcriptional regulator
MNVHIRAGDGAALAARVALGQIVPPGTTVRTFAARETVFRAGDPADAAFEVVSGCVLVWSSLADGRRLIRQVALPGDAIGFAAGAGHTASAETVVPTRLRAVSADDDHRDRLLRRHIDTLEAHALSLARMSALERLAGFLLRLAEHTGAPRRKAVVVDLVLGRAEIADHLGLTIETVSRGLTKLRRDGLIRLEKYDHAVIIPDLAALAVTASLSVPSVGLAPPAPSAEFRPSIPLPHTKTRSCETSLQC